MVLNYSIPLTTYFLYKAMEYPFNINAQFTNNFRGRPIYSVGTAKQVKLKNAFIKSVDLKFPEV